MSSSNSNVYEVAEDKIKLEGKQWDDPVLQELHAKKTLQFTQRQNYWKYSIERGRRLCDYYQGKILSDEAREEYEQVLDKIVVEPHIMKGPIRALVGQMMKGRRSGQVTTEGASLGEEATDAEEVEVVNLALKDLEVKTEEKYLVSQAAHDSHVACYPCVLLYEKCGPHEEYQAGGFKLTCLPWDSTMLGPVTIKRTDGADVKDLMFWDWRSQADLEESFPEMEKQIRDHFEELSDGHRLTSIAEWEGSISSEDRDTLYDTVKLSSEMAQAPNGRFATVMHLFPIIRREKVWYNFFTKEDNDYVMKPPDWDEERWQTWLSSKDGQKYDGPYETDVRVLWCTVFTLSGLILENKKHWYQNFGKLPASFWVGAMDFGAPSGLGADEESKVLANCIAEIEHLDELRKASGKLLFLREGAIKNIQDLPSELGKAVGIAVVSQTFNGTVQDAFNVVQNQPNPAWEQYAQKQKSDMADETRINETLMGEHAPRQAALAKNLEIAQALIVNAVYIDSFNRSWEYHQNLKCSILPFVYSENEIIQLRDEETEDEKRAIVNAQQLDSEGNVVGVINDLTAHRYRYRLNPTDDSPTAKMQQIQDAAVIINATSGPLIKADPSGQFFAKFLMSVPNSFCKQAGKAMAQDAKMRADQESSLNQQQTMMEAQKELLKAQAELEKARKAGTNVSFTGEEFVQYPNLFALYQQLVQAGFGQQQPAAQPPAAQPAPAMPMAA